LSAADPDLLEDVLFVGSSRQASRPAVAWAVDRGLPIAVYGAGWESLPAGVRRGTQFPNERLGSLYASAKVVLNDHWDDMRELGFVSNRIFDVLGAGGVVVSDRLHALKSLFGDLVPTYGDADELESVVRDLLADDDRRREIGARGARLVAAQHTFDSRAHELAPLLRTGLEGRLRDVEGSRWSRRTLDEVSGAARDDATVGSSCVI
jgi:hypothetical protein